MGTGMACGTGQRPIICQLSAAGRCAGRGSALIRQTSLPPINNILRRGDNLEDKTDSCHNYSVLYWVLQLYAEHTHMSNEPVAE